jgi:hypothetical protein
MPVHLSKSGKAVLGPGGKKEKTFASKAAAKAYLTARNLAHARKKGYDVPPPKRKKKRRKT